MFIGFVNFYQHFIQGFNRIATLFILLLKITELSNLALKAFKVDNNEVVEDGDRVNKIVVNLSKTNKSKNLIYISNIGAIKKPAFSITNIKKTFNRLK